MSEAVRSRRDEWLALQAQIADLLSRHGRNARQDGDYCLIDRDFGTYEQKVLVFFKDALSPELVEATENLLSNYSREWHVSFVEANKDGTEMVPPGGLKVSAYGLELLQRAKVSPEEDRETRELYAALDELLGMRGKSDAFGNGDYWIVDDSWVPLSHKVCVFNIAFLTPALAAEVQRLLNEKFPRCVVWFQIEVVEPGVELPLPGVRVFSDRIEQDWDREKMRSMFNERFKW